MNAPFGPDRPCRHYARMVYQVHARCARPGGVSVQAIPERGCAYWVREPGADDNVGDAIFVPPAYERGAPDALWRPLKARSLASPSRPSLFTKPAADLAVCRVNRDGPTAPVSPPTDLLSPIRLAASLGRRALLPIEQRRMSALLPVVRRSIGAHRRGRPRVDLVHPRHLHNGRICSGQAANSSDPGQLSPPMTPIHDSAQSRVRHLAWATGGL
jgi:hypothetical protein